MPSSWPQSSSSTPSKIKQRPARVLFEEHGNIVVAGITSNTALEGIPFHGLPRPSYIKINYVFTISEHRVIKSLTTLAHNVKAEIKGTPMNNLDWLSAGMPKYAQRNSVRLPHIDTPKNTAAQS
ncbi:MAG: type II toxin-antitoxin system PemK/MazF family toxin [Nitrosarchaeum sp.]|nr:type II toxin-antitoxin system PemK/MazF family toxin [Nitrosarchaeum sp.]